MHLRVVLVEPEHDGNVGSIARLMMNFNFDDLWVVNSQTPVGKEAMAFASHAKGLLATHTRSSNLDEALKDISLAAGTTSILPKRSANVLRTAVTPEEFARIVEPVKGTVALLLGRESRGLSNGELEKCDLVVSIPTSYRYRALNVASAAAVLFYELWKHQHDFRRNYTEEASRESRRRLVEMFGRLCEEVRISPYKQGLAVRAFLNVLSRAPATSRETSLLIGVIRQTMQKLKGEF